MHLQSSRLENFAVVIVCVIALASAAALARAQQSGPLAVSQQSGLAGVPVGTVLPYIGPLDALPSEWVPCDGRIVSDPNSPLDGVQLPDLSDGRFLMGVGSETMIGVSGGSNAISTDGAHTHNGTATNRIQQQAGAPRNLETNGSKGFRHTHKISLQTNSGHDHGGDKRPAFFGVRFIVRIK